MGKKARFTLKVIKAWIHFVKSVTFLGWKSENFQRDSKPHRWWFKQIFAGQLFVHCPFFSALPLWNRKTS